MPRPQKPVDPDSPLADFALGLRALRSKQGLTYRKMAEVTNFGITSLSRAADGRLLPTLDVTLAYVTACGGSPDEWRAHWNEASRKLNSGNGWRHA
jgi:transcriptional regulator with XRE-family HTH domain